MKTTKFSLTRDVNGYNGFGLEPSNKLFSVNLAQLVEQILTLPGDYEHYFMLVINDPGSRVYVAYNATATVPGPVFAATDSELNPVGRRVKAFDEIHMITPDLNCNVTVALYGLNENYV